MDEFFSIDGKTDDELLSEYSVDVDGRKFVPSRLLDAIGDRQVRLAARKPGDPGTVENPIFYEGKAYIYGRRNKLILWEDYSGSIPDGMEQNITGRTEKFTLTIDMKPTDEQKKMIQCAMNMPVVITNDCPLMTSERLSTFSRFESARPVNMK